MASKLDYMASPFNWKAKLYLYLNTGNESSIKRLGQMIILSIYKIKRFANKFYYQNIIRRPNVKFVTVDVPNFKFGKERKRYLETYRSPSKF